MIAILFSLLVSFSAHADTDQLICESKFNPDFLAPLESPVEHGTDEIPTLKPGDTISLLVWNIYKAQRSNFWRDFSVLTESADLSLFQESVLSEENWGRLQAMDGVMWQSAMSFKMNDSASTGLTTGSRYLAKGSEALESPVREPLARTPKLSMLTEIPIEGRDESLMVVNIHAINFVLPSRLFMQLEVLIRRLENHNGPLIIAGDFNTHFFRNGILEQFKSRLDLDLVEFEGDRRWFKFDRIYVRGLSWSNAEILRSVQTSDHKPLAVDLKLLN